MVGFVTESSQTFAGRHLLADFFQCQHNASMEEISSVMVKACKATGATVLFHHAHPFSGEGSSGAVILAESHASWHQWPENNFVAIDFFVCGNCDPTLALPLLRQLFQPQQENIQQHKRGLHEFAE
jgi:S-adenosylmethionine decarboxylase